MLKTILFTKPAIKLVALFDYVLQVKTCKKINYINIRNDHSTIQQEIWTKGTSDEFINKKKESLEVSQTDTVEGILKNYPDKVKSLSQLFECSEETACHLLIKFTFLKTTEMASLQPKVAELLESGLTKDVLMNDMWIFTYSLPKLKDNLQLVKSMNCNPIMPWHLRCSKEVLQRLSQNKEINRIAMSPHGSLTDYICKRLGFTEAQIESFAKRHPPVMRVKVAKFKQVIDFLLSEGFTAEQIFCTPRIICHSLKTTQKRLAILRSHNYEPYSLYVLCKNQHKFDEFVSKISNSKK